MKALYLELHLYLPQSLSSGPCSCSADAMVCVDDVLSVCWHITFNFIHAISALYNGMQNLI